MEFSDEVLHCLLADPARGRPITWAATDAADRSGACAADALITPALARGIARRVAKPAATRALRTRQGAEVFTPAWLCNLQNNVIDAAWFGRPGVFTVAAPGQRDWQVTSQPVPGDWRAYVREPRAEITCGEAPYLTSRYDAVSGEPITVRARIGLLDRKLRVVGENTRDARTWVRWAQVAVSAIHGFEKLGDSLFLARANLLATYLEHRELAVRGAAPEAEVCDVASIIAANVAQSQEWVTPARCEAVVGNPPYQHDVAGSSARPIYPQFLEQAYAVTSRACFVTPARFLFRAGKTSKSWNEKMLCDPHLSVTWFEEDAASVFPGTEIKGGLVVTMRDTTRTRQPVGVFSPHPEVASILAKLRGYPRLSSLVHAPESYSFADALHLEHPGAADRLSQGHARDLTTNCFAALGAEIFSPEPFPGAIGVYGRLGQRRVVRYIAGRYVSDHPNLWAYAVALPKANGSGRLGEALAASRVLPPGMAHTQTFISMGAFATREEAERLALYLRTKFARVLLGTLKVTQDNKRRVWQNVPLLDFSDGTSLPWGEGVAALDESIAELFHLTHAERAFIDRMGRAMPDRDKRTGE